MEAHIDIRTPDREALHRKIHRNLARAVGGVNNRDGIEFLEVVEWRLLRGQIFKLDDPHAFYCKDLDCGESSFISVDMR